MLLEEVLAALGGAPVNVDVTIVCEEPNLGAHKRAIAARIGSVIGVPVSIKATTNEGMGASAAVRGSRLRRSRLLKLD